MNNYYRISEELLKQGVKYFGICERLDLTRETQAILDAGPIAQDLDLSVKPQSQDWARMDGAVAWHLIDRHGDSWADIGFMMDELINAKIENSLIECNSTKLDMSDEVMRKGLNEYMDKLSFPGTQPFPPKASEVWAACWNYLKNKRS